jgi:drug/metabolite transporter (DMT)-like permease
MWRHARVPHRLTIGLAIAIVLDTVVQLSWKSAAAGISDAATPWATLETAIKQPMFLVVGALLLCQLVNWLQVLSEADLSFAQPLTSLSRVTVCLTSAIFLNETLSPMQFGGILLVCAGVWCITRTGRESPVHEAQAHEMQMREAVVQ